MLERNTHTLHAHPPLQSLEEKGHAGAIKLDASKQRTHTIYTAFQCLEEKGCTGVTKLDARTQRTHYVHPQFSVYTPLQYLAEKGRAGVIKLDATAGIPHRTLYLVPPSGQVCTPCMRGCGPTALCTCSCPHNFFTAPPGGGTLFLPLPRDALAPRPSPRCSPAHAQVCHALGAEWPVPTHLGAHGFAPVLVVVVPTPMGK